MASSLFSRQFLKREDLSPRPDFDAVEESINTEALVMADLTSDAKALEKQKSIDNLSKQSADSKG